jgi:hypothetical protein
MKKKPSTSELLDCSSFCWSRISALKPCVSATRRNTFRRLHGALLKNEQAVHLFERLAFMARRETR